MKLYHKIFMRHADMSVYLENMDLLISYNEELLNRLINARNQDELHDVKCSILRDFSDICTFDISDAEFPEPIGHFDDEKEKNKLIRKKILLQDMAFYLGNLYKKYHLLIYQKHSRLPEIELKKLAIDYNEIYRKAMEDYTAALVYTPLHGTGNVPVRTMLSRLGYNFSVVNEQCTPDGNFSNTKSPNPENKKSFERAITLAVSFVAKEGEGNTSD